MPADSAQALRDRTEVKLAAHGVAVARAAQRLEQANARPDVQMSFGYKRNVGVHSALGYLEIPLPVFNRNQGAIAAAVADARAWESETAAQRAMVLAEVRAAQTDVDLRYRQLTEMLRSALDRAVESSNIARAAYLEGGADLLRLLDAERVRIELEVHHTRTAAEYWQSIAALELAMGVEP
jgi:outer membrane protein TolC